MTTVQMNVRRVFLNKKILHSKKFYSEGPILKEIAFATPHPNPPTSSKFNCTSVHNFVKNQLDSTFPRGSMFRNWRLIIFFFLLSIYAWQQNREVKKTFYSLEEFEEWNMKNFSPFPYKELTKQQPTSYLESYVYNFYYWVTFNYFSDVPLIVELTATKKNCHEKVVKQRIFKIRTRMSAAEVLKTKQNPNDEILKYSQEHHSFTSFRKFMAGLKDAPTESVEQCDWLYVKESLKRGITEKCELGDGIKIHFLYKPRFSQYYLIILLKSIVLS